MSRSSRLFCALASLVVLLGLAAPASAHDTLLASTPADGATLDAPPTEVTLEMSAPALELGTEVQVLDAAGTNVAAAPPTVTDRFVTTPLGDVAAGDYTVVWRVVSSDGHPIDGTFTFTVTAVPTPEPTTTTPASPEASPSAEETATPSVEATPSETASADASASASDEPSADATTTAAGSGISPVVVALIVAGVVVVGGVVIWLVRRRSASGGDAPTDGPPTGGAPRE